MRRWLPLIGDPVCGAVLLGAPDAMAHGIVGREDLPIPRWLFGWAATAVLVLSFVALAVLWPQPRLERAQEREIARCRGRSTSWRASSASRCSASRDPGARPRRPLAGRAHVRHAGAGDRRLDLDPGDHRSPARSSRRRSFASASGEI